jgi:hypothetical protein
MGWLCSTHCKKLLAGAALDQHGNVIPHGCAIELVVSLPNYVGDRGASKLRESQLQSRDDSVDGFRLIWSTHMPRLRRSSLAVNSQ